MSQRVSSLTYLVAMDEMKESSEQLERYTTEIKILNKAISKSRVQLDLKQKKLKAIKRNLESKQKTLAKLRNADKPAISQYETIVEDLKTADDSFGEFEIVTPACNNSKKSDSPSPTKKKRWAGHWDVEIFPLLDKSTNFDDRSPTAIRGAIFQRKS